ncbi:phage minor head protein [Paracoccus sp. ME4]|uniref:phage head morphogenesis protein n=1 Tax=Paracoccus sp. ME4 TaxID=3138066 RepID=UPI00398B896C
MARIELAPLPHREAIEYLRSKGYAHELQRFHHLDHFREEHARNWVVAKAVRDDVTRAIRAEVEKTLEEGRTLTQFQQSLAPRLVEMGWWGKGLMEDPVTGEMEEVQLGSMHRLRTIFDTNMRTSHAAGHWAAIWRTRQAFPYLEYVQIERRTKRHDHARFHGKIWRVDDPVWQRIYPPNGYFCGCTVIQRTEGWMRRNGRQVDAPLDLDEVAWTNKRSGEISDVPRGITLGFDTNPGAVWLDGRAAWDRVAADLPQERRSAEYGLIEGLRLRGMIDGREGLVMVDGSSQPVQWWRADPSRPGMVGITDPVSIELPSFLHNHLTDASLSSQDILTLFGAGGQAITAITPGGSIWRAARIPGGALSPSLIVMRDRLFDHQDNLRATEHGAEIFMHARMLYLEKRGLVTYSWHMSERVRQIMDAHADLIARLSDG